MIFKRMTCNEWALLYDISASGPDTAADKLSFELQLVDMNFVLYTCWPGFCPDAAYLLELPHCGGDIEAVDSMVRSAQRRKIGAGFCDVRLALTDETVSAAQSGNPPCCTLRFHAPEYRWEYIFLPGHGSALDCKTLCLEAAGGEIRYSFQTFEKVREFDMDAYRTVSNETIPMKEKYGFRLRLCASAADNRPKRIIMRDIPPPVPGKHRTAVSGFLRQVCCI